MSTGKRIVFRNEMRKRKAPPVLNTMNPDLGTPRSNPLSNTPGTWTPNLDHKTSIGLRLSERSWTRCCGRAAVGRDEVWGRETRRHLSLREASLVGKTWRRPHGFGLFETAPLGLCLNRRDRP